MGTTQRGVVLGASKAQGRGVLGAKTRVLGAATTRKGGYLELVFIKLSIGEGLQD